MSVPNQTPYNIYTANGLTTVFAYEFYLISAGDIQVTINGAVIAGGYSVGGVGNVGGGDITFLTPPANGAMVMLERNIPTYRLTDYQDNGDLLADTVNKDFDRLWMAIQRAFIYLGLALTRPLLGGPFNAKGYRIENLSDPVNDYDAANKHFVTETGKANLAKTLRVAEPYVEPVPMVSARRNKILAFNSWGNPITVLPESGSAADVLITLASGDDEQGAGLIGVDIESYYGAGTVGRKLSLFLSPWDFGAIADGTLHALSEFFASLDDAKKIYPFVTSLEQSVDYAAMQKCANEMIARGAAGMTMGLRGRFCINDTVSINKTGSVNESNKCVDFLGAEIMTFQGQLVFNDRSFSGWSLQNGVSVSAGLMTFAGNTSAQARAIIPMNGLVVGKTYAVSVVTEEYSNAGYLRIRINTSTAISRATEYGPGVRFAEFVATATTQNLILQDDAYDVTPVSCKIKEVDVRESTAAIRVYQTGTAITHGSFTSHNLRIVNKNSNGFCGLRTEDMNHAVFTGITAIDGYYGSGTLMCNMHIWSENNTFHFLKIANCREAVRFTRPMTGRGSTNSFARTTINKLSFAGCRYAYAFEIGTSAYDSVFGPIVGNLTAAFRAIFMLHGDQTGSVAESIRVENNSAPSGAGVFEYGKNDLRRIYLGSVTPGLGIGMVAVGSLSVGSVSRENEMMGRDFRPSVPIFAVQAFQPKSGSLGTGLTYTSGTYQWSEIITDCEPGKPYALGDKVGLFPDHGIIDLDVSMRLANGDGYQGTKLSTKLLKATVFTANANVQVVYSATQVIGSESITAAWGANTAPELTHSASVNRGLQIFARWTR